MARMPRRLSRNGIYHVMLRGINRQTIFEDDEDKLRFLTTLKRFKEISNIKLYSYCLMDNHVHLLVRETVEPISKAIQRISSSYVYWYNEKYERNGHLFQERFKSENVETIPYFLTVLRYIHQNPVKAELETNVFNCVWTSVHEYMHTPYLIDTDFGFDLLSTNRKKAIKLFTAHTLASNEDQCLDDFVKVKMSDSEVISHLDQLGIPKSSTLQQMERKKRNAIIKELRSLNGVSIRQLARITGISKSVIDRIR